MKFQSLAVLALTALAAVPCEGMNKIQSVELLQETVYPTNTVIEGEDFPIGGISGISYDPTRDVYYMICDDLAPGTQRFFTATIDLETFEVEFLQSTILTHNDGSVFGDLDFDGEGIQYRQDTDTLLISSERYPLGIYEFGLDGVEIRALHPPHYHIANVKPGETEITVGVIDNEGPEGLSITPDGKYVWVANEAALAQDGPRATPDNPTTARWYQLDIETGLATGLEYVAIADATSVTPEPADDFQISGWTEIVALNDDTTNWLALDRSFAVGDPFGDGNGHDVRLYEVDLVDADGNQGTNVYGMHSLPDEYISMTKFPLVDFRADYNITSDNFEGLQLMPQSETEAILIVVSDDNFGETQFNQFLFLKMTGDFSAFMDGTVPMPSAPAPSPSTPTEPTVADPLEIDYTQAGTEVSFTVFATDDIGPEPYTYAWDCGDGTAITPSAEMRQNPLGDSTYNCSYPMEAATYTASVTVTNADGGVNSVDTEVEVTSISVCEKEVEKIRICSYNTAMTDFVGRVEGAFAEAAADPTFVPMQRIADVMQRAKCDIIQLGEMDQIWTDGEFDMDATLAAYEDFQRNFLQQPQAEGNEAVYYDYVFASPQNTGVPSGYDLNNDGEYGTADDAYGFGDYPGAHAFAFFSKYPIATDEARTFQYFLWDDMPDALLPPDPQDVNGDGLNSWYNSTELGIFRLSSKTMMDVPVDLPDGEIVHCLMGHPTPPIYDDGQAQVYPDPNVVDWNGLRNHDEIRLFRDYVTPGMGDYIYDDAEWTAAGGATPANPIGGLPEGTLFAILGDMNADPVNGESTFTPINMILNSTVTDDSFTPRSDGGEEQANENKANRETLTTAFDPDGIADDSRGSVRADYAVPSVAGFGDIECSFVWWPTTQDLEYYLMPASDHFMVSFDIDDSSETNAPAPAGDPTDAPTDAPSGAVNGSRNLAVTAIAAFAAGNNIFQ